MNTLASPTELNGSLVSVLLPLRTNHTPGFSPTELPMLKPGPLYAYDTSPFLPARAQLEARSYEALVEQVPQFHSWPTPVLVASKEWTKSQDPATFGRSVSTLLEQDEGDQPLTMAESFSASLWVVPGSGLVIAFEKLAASLDIAHEANMLGRGLHRPATDRVGLAEREGFQRVLEHMGVRSSDTLADIFGGEFGRMVDPVTPTDKPLGDLLIPRGTVVAGNRMVEGIVVGLASAPNRDHLGIADLFASNLPDDGFDAQDAWQSEGYRWDYSRINIADEPADPAALSVTRSDGRVLVVDLDSMSTYHDYLGAGGAGSVLELLPLAALMGQLAGDHADVREVLGGLTTARQFQGDNNRALEDGLRVAGRVRAKLQLRRLEQPQLTNEQNFRSWSVDEALRREITSRALTDSVDSTSDSSGADMATLIQSIESLEASLVRLHDEERLKAEKAEKDLKEAAADREQRAQRTLETGLGVLSAAGVVGLFAALASVPARDRLLPTLATAGLYTVLSLLLIGSLVLWGVSAAKQQRTAGRPLRRVAAALFAGSGLAAIVGLAQQEADRLIWCVVSAVLLVVGGGTVLRVISESAPSQASKSPDPN